MNQESEPWACSLKRRRVSPMLLSNVQRAALAKPLEIRGRVTGSRYSQTAVRLPPHLQFGIGRCFRLLPGPGALDIGCDQTTQPGARFRRLWTEVNENAIELVQMHAELLDLGLLRLICRVR